MTLLYFLLIGATAQLIDGSLGMGFGLLSSTFLVFMGSTAAIASASVHMAEIGTTLASGISHWRAENVDKRIVLALAIPGSIGAFIGANFLSNIDLTSSKNFISTVLLLMGLVLFYRNVFTRPHRNLFDIHNRKYVALLGFSGGFIDASGGGGWGPIVTSTILSTTTIEPRKAIGTVSASEFCVALAASLGFLFNIEKIGFEWVTVAGLALGGILLAPISAKLVSILNSRVLGACVGIAIIMLNGFNLATHF